MITSDTIAAVATPPGKGGVAIVRVSGIAAWEIAAVLTGLTPEPRKVHWARFKRDGNLLDEGLLLAFKAPHSYTGEDVVEFHCHGGLVTPKRILEACYALGARPAERGEFTRRAFLNGKLSYEQAQGVLDIIEARTSLAADAALSSLGGRATRHLKELYSQILDVAVRVEYALDIDEGELPEDFWGSIISACDACAENCAAEYAKGREKRLLREGVLVVLAGPPNAGKSSLMNALLGEARAIVSDTPGTTRDTIEEGLSVDGWPVRLVDTAGLRETTDAIEAEGVRRTNSLIEKADIILNLDPNPTEPCAANEIRLHTKCDLGRGEGLNVSAKTGEGLEDLRQALAAKIAAQVAAQDETATDSFENADAALLAAQKTLEEARSHAEDHDAVLTGNALRRASEVIGDLTGAVYTSDMLDRLFSRFCVGK